MSVAVAGLHLLLAGMVVLAAEESGTATRTDLNVYYAGDSSPSPDRELQSLDIYWQESEKPLPVIVYVHGGGWAFGDKADVNGKPDYFLSQGIAFISMNYRLRWDHTVFDQMEDIVSVIGWIRKNADRYNLDAGRIILMGHAAGAHLVSLVATNEDFLKAAGLSLADINSIVAIDTASFDINRLMTELGSFIERRQHRLIFGDDENVWREASPIFHVDDSKSIPAFAILYQAADEQTRLQAMGFSRKLNEANVGTIIIPVNDKSVRSIDAMIGAEGNVPTQALMAFIRARL